MIKNYTYKYRIYPTKKQEVLLSKHFGCVRFLFNHCLSKQNKNYENGGKFISKYEQTKIIPILKKNGYEWLKEVNAQSLQHGIFNLHDAFKSFFNKTSSYPRFKKKGQRDSFHIPQKIKVENNRLYITKFQDGIKIKLHEPLIGLIRNCTISYESNGKYYASILVHKDIKELPKTNEYIGIDLGIKDLVICSDGLKFKNHKYTNKYERLLKKAYRHLSRKKKGSYSYKKQVRKIARIHDKIKCSRKDYIHKITTQLVRKYDIICTETLKVKNMVKNKRLSKSLHDASFGMFVEFLRYKCEWYGKILSKIDNFFPSSKTCSCCGSINKNLTLNIREWVCEECGVVHDRDINASINILNEGLRLLKIT